jgi:hypothetical protein
MTEMDQIGTSAAFRRIDMTDLEAEIIHHRQKATRRIAGTEITVDVGLCQPGIFQRALSDLGVKLCGGFIGCVPGRMFINSSNVSLAPDGQIVLRLRFLFRVPSPTQSLAPATGARITRFCRTQ